MSVKEPRAGVFVVFEGIDGAGTTTQADRYARHLRGRGRAVHLTREPSDGPIGALIRLVLRGRTPLRTQNQAETMALLFAADRLDHVASELTEHLDAGAVVLSDRYDLSSLAYQSATAGAGSADVVAWIRELNRHARRPDVTVVLDVSPAVAEERRRARGGARELFEEAELQARLAAAYASAERLVPGDRVVHIDGDAPPDAVADAVAAALRPIVEA